VNLPQIRGDPESSVNPPGHPRANGSPAVLRQDSFYKYLSKKAIWQCQALKRTERHALSVGALESTFMRGLLCLTHF
jgi:hypothetical protein